MNIRMARNKNYSSLAIMIRRKIRPIIISLKELFSIESNSKQSFNGVFKYLLICTDLELRTIFWWNTLLLHAILWPHSRTILICLPNYKHYLLDTPHEYIEPPNQEVFHWPLWSKYGLQSYPWPLKHKCHLSHSGPSEQQLKDRPGRYRQQ